MAIENRELMYECFPKHLRMGTARLKSDNKTEEESKKRRMIVERSTVDTKKRSPVQSLLFLAYPRSGCERKRSPDGLSLPNQNTILINITRYFRKKLIRTMKFK